MLMTVVKYFSVWCSGLNCVLCLRFIWQALRSWCFHIVHFNVKITWHRFKKLDINWIWSSRSYH